MLQSDNINQSRVSIIKGCSGLEQHVAPTSTLTSGSTSDHQCPLDTVQARSVLGRFWKIGIWVSLLAWVNWLSHANDSCDLDLFHEKYQWEIWKNTAGKSAILGPTLQLRMVTLTIILVVWSSELKFEVVLWKSTRKEMLGSLSTGNPRHQVLDALFW